MEENQKKETLYIPQGLKQKREYFDGYGNYELCITIIATLCTAILSYLINKISGNLILAIFLLLAIPSTTVLFVIKNNCNISVVDQIKFMIRFAKSQKKYPYVAKDEWEL